MITNTLRALWTDPRPAQPPVPVWRDGVLVGVLVVWAVVEGLLRADLAWRPLVLLVSVVVALSLLWRRTHPLAVVVVAFGMLTVVDIARILGPDEARLLSSVAGVLVLPYALLRWGSGRESVMGVALVLVWLGVTHVADPTDPAETAAAYGFFLFSAALGASIRFHAKVRIRDIEEAKLRQRGELARELHDAVGHHVSAIAIQAQAGRVVAASDPDRAVGALETIEKTASRALAEMRAMVGILRDGAEPNFAPQPGIRDIEELAGEVEGWPRVDVHLSGYFGDVSPAVGIALYRIAQESVMNAFHHAPRATRVSVEVTDDDEQVRLTINDDGGGGAVPAHAAGFGLVGMNERASLLGGTLRAGRDRNRGWKVEASLPKDGVA
ncbi:MAG: sensor histidine kinase [Solirubrobacterales bacterium]|nr:sensor histidine kinase [Solirubrobacterales bacterium]